MRQEAEGHKAYAREAKATEGRPQTIDDEMMRDLLAYEALKQQGTSAVGRVRKGLWLHGERPGGGGGFVAHWDIPHVGTAPTGARPRSCSSIEK